MTRYDLKLYSAFCSAREVRFYGFRNIPKSNVVDRSTDILEKISYYLATESGSGLTTRYVCCRETQLHKRPHLSSPDVGAFSATEGPVLDCLDQFVEHHISQQSHFAFRHIFDYRLQTKRPKTKALIGINVAINSRTERHQGGVFSLIHNLPTPSPGELTLLSHSMIWPSMATVIRISGEKVLYRS